MNWELREAVEYYRGQGAPEDQTAIVSLLREVQKENGDALTELILQEISERLPVQKSILYALVRRIPDLRLSEYHILEICGGPNCSKRAALVAFAEKNLPPNIRLKVVPCMRLCGGGPNLRFDGIRYHQADESLLKKLLSGAKNAHEM